MTTYFRNSGVVGVAVAAAAIIAFPHVAGFLWSFILGFVWCVAGVFLAELVASYLDTLVKNPPLSRDVRKRTGMAIMSLILGTVGLAAWILPLLGLPITIIGYVLGRKAQVGTRKLALFRHALREKKAAPFKAA